jgi:hypothetical protein
MGSSRDFETFPDRIKSGHELAFPMINTTVSIDNFAASTVPNTIFDLIVFPKRISVISNQIEYPFFIGEYSLSQRIKWLEPTKNNSITIANTFEEAPETLSGLTNINQFISSSKAFFDESVSYLAETASTIIRDKTHNKFAFGFKQETDLIINS